jgi:cysteine synthase A
MTTIPQVFIAGEFIGGCTDVFNAHKGGQLQALLDKRGVSYDRTVHIDPYSFLPSWLHPR